MTVRVQANDVSRCDGAFPSPTPQNLYLHLFHGRDTDSEEMEEWGADGPYLGPLDRVHIAYMGHPHVVFSRATDAEAFGFSSTSVFLRLSDGNCIEFNGRLYGDFTVAKF